MNEDDSTVVLQRMAAAAILSEARKGRRMGQVQLAALLGVSQSSLCRIEQGATEETVAVVVEVARHLNLEARALFMRVLGARRIAASLDCSLFSGHSNADIRSALLQHLDAAGLLAPEGDA